MNSQFVFFADKQIGEQIGTLHHETVYPFWSNGRWAMHNLLSWLLKQTGPAKVQLSTFSISEIALRSLANDIETGKIQKLQCLFDFSIRQNKLQLLFFAKQLTADIRINAIHAKVLLIENDNFYVTVVGSANMTPNPRKEAGIILTDKVNFKAMQGKFVEIINESKKLDFNEAI